MAGSGNTGSLPRRSCVVLILDGLGDRPVPELGERTPLEVARTPNLDRMAGAGGHGLVDPVARGVVPNTHSGVGLMLGLEPGQASELKRGPIEAAGAGVELRPGDVAFRANLATLEDRDGRLFVADRRAGRVTGMSAAFAAELAELDLGDGIRALFRPTDQHRGVLVFRGPGLDAAVSDTDPGDGAAPGPVQECRALVQGACFTAEKVSRFIILANERLVNHPLNAERLRQGKLPVTGVITRGAGAWFKPDSILARQGVRAAMVAGCNTVLGLARNFGVEAIRQEGFTADTDTDVQGKLGAALGALERFPLVYVHIKATDLFSHDFNPGGKRDFIESVDRALDVFEGCGAAFALTADHTTDSNTGAHTADPVPALFYDPAAARPGGESINFGETACREGGLPRRTGHRFLLEIASYLES